MPTASQQAPQQQPSQPQQATPSNHHVPPPQPQQQPQPQPQLISVPTSTAQPQMPPQAVAAQQPQPQVQPQPQPVASVASTAQQPQPQFVPRPMDFPPQPQAVGQQQPQPQRTQFQYMPSGTGSAVNSIPPSRDPKAGAGGIPQVAVGPQPQHSSQVGTPTMGIQPSAAHMSTAQPTVAVVSTNPAGAAALAVQQPQAYLDSATRDSHPIASEELVERLEEISTQQGSPDAAEDPER